MAKVTWIILIVGVMALTACGQKYHAVVVKDTHGVAHECIVYRAGYKGGISCDWGK